MLCAESVCVCVILNSYNKGSFTMPAPPFYLKLLSGESVMLPSRLFPLEFWWIFVCWCLQQG